MSLSPSFSDFPARSGTASSFPTGSSFAHDRATASSMSLVPVIPVTDSPAGDAAATPHPVRRPLDRRANSAAAPTGRNGVERRQFASTHAELSDEGRDLASAIDHYKLQHHRRYLTCDEVLIVLKSLGYEKPSANS